MKQKKLTMAFCMMAALFAYAEEPYLSENLSVWFRADLGVSTNAAGGVTSWANQGTIGSAADVAPAADNSAGHVAYEADGIGGKPSILFDGEVNLETASAIDTGITVDGGAWFVVFKTPCPRDERTNMGIFGGDPGSGRLGIFFPSEDREIIRDNFFSGAAYDYPVYSNVTQIISMHGWKKDSIQMGAVTERWNISAFNYSFSPAAFVLRVGKSLSWTKVLKGEIAEIRIYNRALTRRERCRIEFELCSRYGVAWEGHGSVDNEALSWYEESEQFGRISNTGEPEELNSTVSSGGATLEFLTPSAVNEKEGYFSNNAGAGVSRAWYISTWNSVAPNTGIKLTFDRSKVRIGPNPSLYTKSSYDGAWVKSSLPATETDDSVSFTISANGWAKGYYTVQGELDSHLAMWHRADMGLSTNEAGAVTLWKNSGVYGGNGLDMTPKDDNSAAHIRYNALGMGSGPSVSFDGNTYLSAPLASTLGITANGGAWFVLFKTSVPASERGNMMVFGGEASGQRLGIYFNNNGGADQGRAVGWMFGAGGALATIEENKPQMLSYMMWTENSSRYYDFSSAVGSGGRYGASGMTTGNYKLYIGQGLSWTKEFIGDVAEVRIYNRPLTARERYGIELEMCARFGLPFGSYAPEGISWAANSVILGYRQNEGVPEDIVYSGTAGGVTISIDGTLNPASCSWTYFSQNGETGFDGMWYVYAPDAARALPVQFSVKSADFGGKELVLQHSESAEGPWQRVAATIETVDGCCMFSIPANKWSSGFYRADRRPGFALIIR